MSHPEPTVVLENYLRHSKAELAEWESLIPALTKRLSTAKRRIKEEAAAIKEYEAELERREAEKEA